MDGAIRAGVIGLDDERIWVDVKCALGLPYVKLVGAADADPIARRRFAETTGSGDDAVYEDPLALIEHGSLDAILCGASTHEHAALVELAADRGIAILVEQPMAESLDALDRIVTAVQRAGIPFMVNFPRLWGRALREAVRMVLAGAIGDLFEVRYRVSESPRKLVDPASPDEEYEPRLAEQERGAVLYLCSYGAQLASWLLGTPMSVVGISGTFLSKDTHVYDNSILLLKYPEAFAVAEGSWSGIENLKQGGPEFHGRAGSLFVVGDKLQFVDRHHPEGQSVTPDGPAAGRSSGVEHFFHNLHRGTDFAACCDLATTRAAQEILEAGRRSIETGFECPLPVR